MKENIWTVILGLAVASAVVFMALWSLFETDPQYRSAPDYAEGVLTTNMESEASDEGR